MTSQSAKSVDGEEIPGKALEKRWCLSLFLKAGRAEKDERWHGNLFQVSEAADEKDLDIAFAVFREGMNIDKEEKDHNDCVGTCRGTMAAR